MARSSDSFADAEARTHTSDEGALERGHRSGRWPGLSTPAGVFWLLFSINVVNFLDRLLAVAAGPTLKHEFHLTDRDIGLIASAFLIVYTLAAVPMGLIADRVARAKVVAAGVAVWSAMSAATAVVRGFPGLFITRAGVGIGEASYFPAGYALLSAYFPLEQRARAVGRWGAGQIVGTALAFAMSAAFLSWFGPHLGWRVAFLVAGLPGLGLAALMWYVRDAPRPVTSSPSESPPRIGAIDWRAVADSLLPAVIARFRVVLSIRTVWIIIALQALTYVVVTPTVTFLPIYLRSARSPFHLTDPQASLISGSLIVVGGLGGTLLGGPLADWLSRRIRGGRLLAIGVGYAAGLPCYLITLFTHALPLFVIIGTLTVLTLNLQVGPLGAALQDATPPHLRASTVAVAMLVAHLLGDAWASTAVGSISTALGERTVIGLAVIGAPALLVAVIVAALGAPTYADDVAARAKPADAE